MGYSTEDESLHASDGPGQYAVRRRLEISECPASECQNILLRELPPLLGLTVHAKPDAGEPVSPQLLNDIGSMFDCISWFISDLHNEITPLPEPFSKDGVFVVSSFRL